MQYSDHWRKCRKLVHQYFMESMVTKNYIPLIEGEAVQMVNDMIKDPGHHMLHPKRFSNSIIMSLGKTESLPLVVIILHLTWPASLWNTNPEHS